MSEPFVGQIKMFAGNFAPRGFAFCDGQLLAISGNDALFSLLGTIYGGDGRTTFGLPDLRGRLPLHVGQGPGLSNRPIGSKGGTEKETITEAQLPSHTHTMQGSSSTANQSGPQNRVVAEASTFSLYQSGAPNVQMLPDAITSVGGGQSHTNLMPFLCINFIIALFGVFPSRN